MMDEIFDYAEANAKAFKPKKELPEEILANLDQVFPAGKELETIIREMNDTDKDVNCLFSKRYVPFRITDNKWMTEYVRRVACKITQKEVTWFDVENFVKRSLRFNNARSNFINALIKELTKIKIMQPDALNPVAIHDDIMDSAEKNFGINNFKVGVELEKNTAWRRIIHRRGFENYLKNEHAVSMPSIEQVNDLADKNSRQFADYKIAETSALNFYYNCAEDHYFESCKDARYYAYEAGQVNEKLSLIQRKEYERRIVKSTEKLAEEIKACFPNCEIQQDSGLVK